MSSAQEMGTEYAIELIRLTILNDKQRDRSRKYAVQDISLSIPKAGRTMIYGLPASGKTTIKRALFSPESYPEMVIVNSRLNELLLKDSRDWSTSDYEQKYASRIGTGDFIVADDPLDQAFEFLLNLKNALLVFAGVDGYQFINHFGHVAYLQRGQMVFSGHPREFWHWVKKTNPSELREFLPKYLVETGGDSD